MQATHRAWSESVSCPGSDYLELSSEQLAVGRRPGGIEATGWLHLLLISGSVETLRQRSSKLHAGVGSSSVTMTIGPALMADFD